MKKNLMLFTIIAASIVTLFASDILLPSLTSIAVHFSVKTSNVQLSISFFLAGQVMATLFWGSISDRIGRIQTFRIGLLVFLLSTIICITSKNINAFLLGRLLQGVGSVVVPVIGWALIQDLYHKDRSAGVMSWVGSIIALAPMIAPALGGSLDKLWGWKASFYLILISTTAILLSLAFQSNILPHPKEKNLQPKKNILSSYMNILKDKVFVSYVCMFALLTCGQWCFLTIAPIFYEKKLGLSIDKIGYFLSCSALFFIIGTSAANRLMKTAGIDILLNIGSKLSLGASLVICFISVTSITTPLLLSLSFGLYLLGAALLWGGCSSRALQSYEHNRGSASAVRSLILISFFTLGSYLGRLIHNSLLQAAAAMSLLALISVAIYHSRPLVTHRGALSSQ